MHYALAVQVIFMSSYLLEPRYRFRLPDNISSFLQHKQRELEWRSG